MKCRCLRKMEAPPYSRDQLWPNHPNSGLLSQPRLLRQHHHLSTSLDPTAKALRNQKPYSNQTFTLTRYATYPLHRRDIAKLHRCLYAFPSRDSRRTACARSVVSQGERTRCVNNMMVYRPLQIWRSYAVRGCMLGRIVVVTAPLHTISQLSRQASR